MKQFKLNYPTVLISVFTSALTTNGLAYGTNGHETVGFIAAQLIQGTHAEQRVNALLGTDSLGNAATWADRAKSFHLTDPEMIAFVQANPKHHDYHFTDVPIQEVQYVDGTAGTSANDIVHTMKQCIEVLRGNNTPTTNPHGFTDRIALRLLTHYVGDIHQPLHVGAAYFRQVNGQEHMVDPNIITSGWTNDLGGNWLKYKSNNLHHYWDDEAVALAMSRAGAHTPQDYASIIVQNSPVVPQTPGSLVDWPQKWAEDLLPIAANGHKGLKVSPRVFVSDSTGGPLHPQWTVLKTRKGYENWARDTVDERLTTAGYRLAQVLLAIWP